MTSYDKNADVSTNMTSHWILYIFLRALRLIYYHTKHQSSYLIYVGLNPIPYGVRLPLFPMGGAILPPYLKPVKSCEKAGIWCGSKVVLVLQENCKTFGVTSYMCWCQHFVRMTSYVLKGIGKWRLTSENDVIWSDFRQIRRECLFC